MRKHLLTLMAALAATLGLVATATPAQAAVTVERRTLACGGRTVAADLYYSAVTNGNDLREVRVSNARPGSWVAIGHTITLNGRIARSTGVTNWVDGLGRSNNAINDGAGQPRGSQSISVIFEDCEGPSVGWVK